jgi:hypothetical protein
LTPPHRNYNTSPSLVISPIAEMLRDLTIDLEEDITFSEFLSQQHLDYNIDFLERKVHWKQHKLAMTSRYLQAKKFQLCLKQIPTAARKASWRRKRQRQSAYSGSFSTIWASSMA